MPTGNLYLVEVTVRCLPGLVHDSYLSLDGLQTPPELRGYPQFGSLNAWGVTNSVLSEYKGGGGVKKGQKTAYVLCTRSLSCPKQVTSDYCMVVSSSYSFACLC